MKDLYQTFSHGIKNGQIIHLCFRLYNTNVMICIRWILHKFSISTIEDAIDNCRPLFSLFSFHISVVVMIGLFRCRIKSFIHIFISNSEVGHPYNALKFKFFVLQKIEWRHKVSLYRFYCHAVCFLVALKLLYGVKT